MKPVQVAPDKRHFVLRDSKRTFTPWGNNYGNHGRLIEDYWESDWATVERDFADMRAMGANVVRVHLQFGKFMKSPDRANLEAIERLVKLLALAEREHLYLDLTGLACYRNLDVPAWYDALDEKRRWAAQAKFWEAVAFACRKSPAVFCYDLINEPLVPGTRQESWYTGRMGGLDFLQFIALELGTRRREDVAREWVRLMRASIRRWDSSHMITVGMLPWGTKPNFFSAFSPQELAPDLDFISVHIYPDKGKIDEAMKALRNFEAGKPVVIEETFPLSCSVEEEREFLLESREVACGWIGHYDGESIESLRSMKRAGKINAHDAIFLGWLELFEQLAPTFKAK